MTEHVLNERRGAHLRLSLNRPERRNAITVAMYAALADAIAAAQDDPGIRVITLEGEGVDFTGGNDLADFMKEMPQDGQTDIPVWRLLRALATNQVPLIAAVHGNAVGIGTTMLFHCDLVLAEEGTLFKMPFTELGLVPEAASSLILPRLAGRQLAAKYLLLGEPFGVEEAERFGLVTHRAATGDLAERLETVVGTLLSRPPEAMRLTQRLLRGTSQDEVLERMEWENGHFSERLTSVEVREAIQRFFAARAAR
ncbi:enoyl-CoA hydratase/carnithine racemase [Sphingomonas kaistensis]|uniref:Enoyl-CoA hydratase/carnithine racemase n=1 Tax=Sphingomonas kaistensis TaxID=298708 RepID=A0A7X6BI88_9SPHN|nr:enoyl-CoA hydratase-related protein [Sphingomonas kaistensis]NJC06906.1 enoyl-CoA hydratase/carnithine racemase [Sphingomonas kaistensis]